MPQLIILLLLCLGLCACNKKAETDNGQPGTNAGEQAGEQTSEPLPDLPRRKVLAVFAGTQSDQWTAALIGSLGSRLNFDPWSNSAADDYFDFYGPFDLKYGRLPIDLRIVLSDMDNVAGVDRQAAAANHLLELADEWAPDLVWLDGDQLQYSAGRLLLDNDYQLVFSGLLYDSALYYEAEDRAAGFYRRHSVSGTMGRIWRDLPDSAFHCIVTDDSPEGRRRLIAFTDAEDLLGEGSSLHVLPVFSDWHELLTAIEEMPAEADDLIICAAGETGASEKLLSTDPPSDLLAFCPVPVYVLGPGKLDMLGCSSLLIKPAAQVNEILTVFEANLGKDIPMDEIPSIVPEDMALQVSESAAVMPRSD